MKGREIVAFPDNYYMPNALLNAPCYFIWLLFDWYRSHMDTNAFVLQTRKLKCDRLCNLLEVSEKRSKWQRQDRNPVGPHKFMIFPLCEIVSCNWEYQAPTEMGFEGQLGVGPEYAWVGVGCGDLLAKQFNGEGTWLLFENLLFSVPVLVLVTRSKRSTVLSKFELSGYSVGDFRNQKSPGLERRCVPKRG